MLGTKNPDYDGFRKSKDPEVRKREIRTKQSFKDDCDINKLLAKAMVTGTVSHLSIVTGKPS